jgi:hypothetical protein
LANLIGGQARIVQYPEHFLAGGTFLRAERAVSRYDLLVTAREVAVQGLQYANARSTRLIKGGAARFRLFLGVWAHVAPLITGLALALSLSGGPARGETPRDASGGPQKSTQGIDKSALTLSKFEARRIRHSCQGEANKTSLGGAARTTAVTNCVSSRFAARRAWSECKRKVGARSADKKSRDEALRSCVAERLRQKGDSDHR